MNVVLCLKEYSECLVNFKNAFFKKFQIHFRKKNEQSILFIQKTEKLF